jgi:site-specific recombinase XerD
MSYELIYRVDLGGAQSPFRVVAQPAGREVDWINRFLDQCCVRGLAWHTLRGYAFALTHFVRWWAERHSTDEVTEQALNSSSLLDYMRYHADQQPRPAATTINTRVWVVERALRCLFPNAVPPAAPGFQQFYWRRSALGYGRPRPALKRLRVKEPKRVVTPLSIDEVARFWASFRTGRDLAIVGLMLLQGLRSCEVLALDQEDLILSEAQIRVRGKGNKVRLYAEFTQTDLQREFRAARSQPRHLLPPPKAVVGLQADLASTIQAVQVTQHVLEMFRRTLPDDNGSLLVLDRLANRLTKIAAELRKLGPE